MESASFVELVKNSRGPVGQQLGLSATAIMSEFVGDTAIAVARLGPLSLFPRPIVRLLVKPGRFNRSIEPSPFSPTYRNFEVLSSASCVGSLPTKKYPVTA